MVRGPIGALIPGVARDDVELAVVVHVESAGGLEGARCVDRVLFPGGLRGPRRAGEGQASTVQTSAAQVKRPSRTGRGSLRAFSVVGCGPVSAEGGSPGVSRGRPHPRRSRRRPRRRRGVPRERAAARLARGRRVAAAGSVSAESSRVDRLDVRARPPSPRSRGVSRASTSIHETPSVVDSRVRRPSSRPWRANALGPGREWAYSRLFQPGTASRISTHPSRSGSSTASDRATSPYGAFVTENRPSITSADPEPFPERAEVRSRLYSVGGPRAPHPRPPLTRDSPSMRIRSAASSSPSIVTTRLDSPSTPRIARARPRPRAPWRAHPPAGPTCWPTPVPASRGGPA